MTSAIETPSRGRTGISRVSIAGLMLAFALSAAVATAVGVAAWSIGSKGQQSAQHLAAMRTQAYQQGLHDGEAKAAAGVRSKAYGSGTRVGFRKGYKKGLATGRVQGAKLGRSDGYRLGYAAGLTAKQAHRT